MTALARHATLKLRASYGVTGNQGIGDFDALSLVTAQPYGASPGIAQTSIGNPNLRWETTHAYDIGADLGLLDNRVTVIAVENARHYQSGAPAPRALVPEKYRDPQLSDLTCEVKLMPGGSAQWRGHLTRMRNKPHHLLPHCLKGS